MLGATAVIFLMMGRYFAPYYENLSNAATGDEGTGISEGMLITSGVFGVLLVVKLIYRYKAR